MKKCNEEYAYIVTKPLQLMTVMALLEQFPSTQKHKILVVDSFENAFNVCRNLILYVQKNCTVMYFKHENEAYRHFHSQSYKKIFVDSDVGFKKYLEFISIFFKFRNVFFCVYEEGVGTYRSDLYSGFKKKFLQFLGCGVYFGANWMSKELYIYHPDKYLNKIPGEIKLIQTRLSELLENKKDIFDAIFDADQFRERVIEKKKSDDCVIYLTSWSIDLDLIENLKSNNATVIIKPHPHIKDFENLLNLSMGLLAPAGIPAEIIILDASKIFKNVSVLHHGSSTEQYINIENVVFQKQS